MRTIVWFRGKDLRLADHEPLRAALGAGEVLCLFVLDPYFFAPERARRLPHRMQFLLESLDELAQNVRKRGSHLALVSGKSVDTVPRLCREWKADRVVAQRWSEPFARERDRRVKALLGDQFELYEGETLCPPGSVRTQAGTPYSVFTSFAKALEKTLVVDEPRATPRALPAWPSTVATQHASLPTLTQLGIRRNDALLKGGESRAKKRLRRFVQWGLGAYARQRDRMDLQGTSRLSADLHFGTLSVRQVWGAVKQRGAEPGGAPAFLNELFWREFAHSTLWARPELLEEPFRPAFSHFPWRSDEVAWRAWVQGETGYPIVDASARQLLAEGFVHNRARMISASFLTKHLLLDYRRGEAHYLAFLVDGDWANNNAGWQWSAGSGCDAQPYFRIFNPVAQGRKFDPNGAYVRRWVPEIAALETRYIHDPWAAPDRVLEEAGVTLGETYPRPIVDHSLARQRFLRLASKHLKPR